jgi:hypothetical protein
MIKLDEFHEEQLSEYLLKGLGEELVDLKNIEVDLDTKIISVDVEFRNVFKSNNNGLFIPHISDILSYRAVGLMLTGFNSIYFNCNKKELGELWQGKYSVNNKRLISPDNKIRVSAFCNSWKEIHDKIFQNWQFDVDNRAFYGDIFCVLKRNYSFNHAL